ncbi:hypothetical protein CWI38_0265p0030 [Hamiltosporidium tvaerminnensis]|uniref:Uncharacterized protein n=1 Tax=Hamiltosporidium tvaerminnensis TaxID=1176355 RepID=A0A4Q9M0D1_9MICR|nr:hypothetical protein CWI38_0265p0030 [Hamiltosporidium tvaerminnensis]
MAKFLKFLFLIFVTAFCTKNPEKRKKYYVDTLIDIIKKEIHKNYIEKIQKYNKICSYEFLFLESNNYFNMESADEIYKFNFAKKPKESHILVGLVNKKEIDCGIVCRHSISLTNDDFFSFIFQDKYYQVRYKNIFPGNYSYHKTRDIREYSIKKHILRFIFWHLNIFKQTINKFISDRNSYSFVSIFSDMIFFENTDYDFISRLLLKQTYTREKNYYLLINDLKINDEYYESTTIKNILDYTFSNTIFDSIKNLSFERKDELNTIPNNNPNYNYHTKIVVKEVHICDCKRYYNLYEIYISSFQDEIIRNQETEAINIFGYSSVNVDIVTFIKSNKSKKVQKSIPEISYIIIRDRQLNMEYHIAFTYKNHNYELVDISVNQNIPGFADAISLKEKISCILGLVIKYRQYFFQLVGWKQTKLISFKRIIE